MKLYISLLLLVVATISVSAQNFRDNFEDNTLRIDYTFAGNATNQIVAVSQLHKTEKWAGRRNNLTQLVRQGNGQVIVLDRETSDTIYVDAFSSLFQEWQSTDEAQRLTRSFENVFLVPFPKKDIKIKIVFRISDGTYKKILEHDVAPNDILIHKHSIDNPYTAIHQGGKVNESINIAIVPEGYTVNEMNLFRKHAKVAVSEILSHKPFEEYKEKLNFFALNTPSLESGVSIPKKNVWKKTLVSSHFDTFYSDRYLTTSNVVDLHNALSGVPYSHIIILANTDTYGGGGIFNSYTLTTTGHPSFAPVVVHEFGHSFAGLADEYFYEGGDIFDTMYSLDIEPWEPNITTLVDFESKWKDLLKNETPIPTPEKDTNKYPVGVYEGGGYAAKGIYRPADDCRMRTNSADQFCPACQRAIEQIIKFYTE